VQANLFLLQRTVGSLMKSRAARELAPGLRSDAALKGLISL